MAQPKNKKRRSRKRARTGPSGGAARSDGAAPAPAAAEGRKAQAKVSKAQRAQKARAARRAAPGPPTVKADRSEAPKPIWAPLPITEGLILVGLIAAVAGLVTQSTGLVLGGFLMIILASLELAVREHLAGYRSHSTLIAAVTAMITAGGTSAILNATDVGLPQWPLLFVAVAVFYGMFRSMRVKFKERSGGLTYRV